MSAVGKVAMKRLFVGTFLDAADQKKLAALAEHKDELIQHWQRKLSMVRAEKLHLTWLFLGKVPEDEIEVVRARLDAVLDNAASCPDLTYTQPVFWPDRRAARMMVLTPDVVPDRVVHLQSEIAVALKGHVERPERRPYRPHITLLRMTDRGGRRPLSVPDWLGLDAYLPLTQQIKRIDLIESHIGGDRSYQAICGWELP